jgi:hypothetical protein
MSFHSQLFQLPYGVILFLGPDVLQSGVKVSTAFQPALNLVFGLKDTQLLVSPKMINKLSNKYKSRLNKYLTIR